MLLRVLFWLLFCCYHGSLQHHCRSTRYCPPFTHPPVHFQSRQAPAPLPHQQQCPVHFRLIIPMCMFVAVSTMGDAPVSLILGGDQSSSRSYVWRLDSATLIVRVKSLVVHTEFSLSITRPLALMRRSTYAVLSLLLQRAGTLPHPLIQTHIVVILI